MKQHYSYKELSAYFDEETNSNVEIELHVKQCVQCQATVNSFTKISDSLQSWDEPEIHPAFATRVLGQLGRQTAPRKNRYQWRFGVVATAAIVLGIFSFMNIQQESALSPDLNRVFVVLNGEDIADEATLLAEMGRRFAEGEKVPVEAGFGFASLKDTDIIDNLTLMLALSSEEAADTVEAQWLSATDSTTALSRLNGAESALFKQLLAESAQKAILGQDI